MKILLFCVLLLASCTKEAITPKPDAPKVDTVRLDTIPNIER